MGAIHVVCIIQWRIWEVNHVASLCTEPSRAGLINLAWMLFYSLSFSLGSRPSESSRSMRCYGCFLAKLNGNTVFSQFAISNWMLVLCEELFRDKINSLTTTSCRIVLSLVASQFSCTWLLWTDWFVLICTTYSIAYWNLFHARALGNFMQVWHYCKRMSQRHFSDAILFTWLIFSWAVGCHTALTACHANGSHFSRPAGDDWSRARWNGRKKERDLGLPIGSENYGPGPPVRDLDFPLICAIPSYPSELHQPETAEKWLEWTVVLGKVSGVRHNDINC